jgi:competence protein CoiA
MLKIFIITAKKFMQIYALDKNGELVPSHKAQKQLDYECMECHEVLRLRSGFQLRPHFYHVKERKSCNLNNKSELHIAVQNHIQNLFPEGEIILEKRFPNRIADCVWEKEKIIFEVQVPPITHREVEGRIRDYKSHGYELVWILSDTRFNHGRVSGAEHFLLSHAHYFTSLNTRGHGMIYDQISWFPMGFRQERLEKRAIQLHQLYRKPPLPLIPERKNWILHFQGDSPLSREEEEKRDAWQERKERTKMASQFLRTIWFYLLKKACT